MKKIIKQFITSTNAFDINSALALFADNAVIDDVSVGKKFKNTKGVRTYLETFFVGYKTVTKLVSIEVRNKQQAKALVDFTGDFGHETGGLDFHFSAEGRISQIDAYLD